MTEITKMPCYDCNMMSPMFKTLSRKELELVNENKTQVLYNAGEIIIKQGTPLTHIVSFTAGLAKVYIEGKKDRNLLLHFLKPTEFLGGPGIFIDSKHYFSLAAIKDSSVCFIELQVFKELIKQNSGFANSFMQYISENSVFNYERFISLTQKNMNGRVADALIYLKNNIFKSESEKIAVSRQDIADYTGMSKDSAIRVLKEFEAERIIALDGREIEVLEYDKLLMISKIS